MHVPHAAPYPDRSRFGLFRPGCSSTSPELGQHPQRRPSIHHMLYVAHALFWTGEHAGGAIDVQVCFWKATQLASVPSRFLHSSAQTGLTPLRDTWQNMPVLA